MPRHPPNTLKTLDRSHLQRPTPERSHDHPTPAPGPGPRHQHCITQSARPNDPSARTHGTPLAGDPTPDRGSPGLRSSPCPTARATRRPRHTPPGTRPARANSCFLDRAGASCEAPGTGMVGQGRLELPTSRLSSARSNQLSYWPSFALRASEGKPSVSPIRHSATRSPKAEGWWRRTGSNRRPAACKAAALPAELRPRRPLRQALLRAPTRPPDGILNGPCRAASQGLDREGMRRRRSRGRGSVSNPDGQSGRTLRKEVIQPQVPLRLPCYDFTPVADLTVAGCLLAVSAPSSGKANSHGVTGGVYKARERIHRGMLIHDY